VAAARAVAVRCGGGGAGGGGAGGGQGNGFCVTYDGNGATVGNLPVDPNNYRRGRPLQCSETQETLAYTGYSFVGWQTKADGSARPMRRARRSDGYGECHFVLPYGARAMPMRRIKWA